MDDFEELLASESDDEHIKEVKRDNNIFTNFGISLNQEKEKEKEKKKPSDNIFKGLLSDENEESDPHLKQKQKKKEEKKHNSLTIKHKKKKNKIPFNLINKKNNIINNIFTSGIESKKKHKGKKSITGIENNEYNDMKELYNIQNKSNINDLKIKIENPNEEIKNSHIINKSDNQYNLNPYVNNTNNDMNLKSISIKNKKKNHPKKFNEDHYEMHLNNIENINDNNLKKSNSINKDLITIDASKKINKNSDCDISEHYYYLNLKPNIDKILSSKLTDTKEVNEQNTKINFLLEQLNIIQKSLKKKKCNKEFLFTQEHFLKIDKITNDYKEQYENLKDRMNIFSVKKYEPEEKENILDEINYYEKKIEYYKTLNKVNENIISRNEKNPEIKEMIIKYVETNYDNLKLENEKLTKIIKRKKSQIPKNEKIIEDLNKQLLELQNNAKVNYNIDDNFNKEIYGIVNKDLIEEKEKMKKQLEAILNFSENKKKKYEDYISNKEQEIKNKTNEINKLSKFLNKESSRNEQLEKELDNNLIPLLNIQKQMEKKKEIERKKQMQDNIIKKIKQKLESEEKLENQKRNNLMLIQSISLEKMKKKLKERNNKNPFNTISNTSLKLKNINNNNSNNNHIFLTEGNDSNRRNMKIKVQNHKRNPSHDYRKITLKTETFHSKYKGKIDNDFLDKDILNNTNFVHNKTLSNNINNNNTKFNKIIPHINHLNKESGYKSDRNIHKLLNENQKIKEEENNDKEKKDNNDSYEINNKIIKKNNENDTENIKQTNKIKTYQDEDKESNINKINHIRSHSNRNYSYSLKGNISIKNNNINEGQDLISKRSNSNRTNSLPKNFIHKIETEEKDKNLNSNKKNYLMLSSDIFKKNDENEINEKNYVTPKFKVFEEDEYNKHHYSSAHKSKFNKSSNKKFIEDSEFETNIKKTNTNNSEKMNLKKKLLSTRSSKNSLRSNHNHYESSIFKTNTFRLNDHEIKNNFNKNYNYVEHNLNSKLSFNQINNKIVHLNSSTLLNKEKSPQARKSLEDNVSEIGNINQNNTKNSYKDSFFSSDVNE